MKLSFAQLSQHLTKQLAPLYLVSSDECLLANEAIEMISEAAAQAGFGERVKITPESHSEWSELLYTNAHSLSLFATKKIIELNLTLTKLNSAQGKILAEYATKPLPDTLLLIQTAKFDTKLEKSSWYQVLEKNGVIIPIWPLTQEQLPLWIMQRAKKLNLNIHKSAADRLSALVEGNLLAAAQEIEKISLLQIQHEITASLIEETVTDSTRFDIFQLVDSALIGNIQRSLQIIRNLAAEGEEPTLILWTLVRELRMLATMQQQQIKGITLRALFSQFRIWEKRQPGVRAFLQRHSLESCWAIIKQAAHIDHLIKGAVKGNIWHELENFLLDIAKKPFLAFKSTE